MKDNCKVRRGFTLIELLAVIIILAVLLAINIPTILNTLKNSTKKVFAADARSVLEVIKNKYMKDMNFDPATITKANMQTEIGISSNEYSQVIFSIVDDKIKVVLVGADKFDGLTAYGTQDNIKVINSSDYDETAPVITIVGSNPVTVIANGIYNDEGATASDNIDGDITSRIIVSNNVNLTIPGTYQITYNVSDNFGNTATVIRTINVTA